MPAAMAITTKSRPVPDFHHLRQRPGERCAKIGKQANKAGCRPSPPLCASIRRRHADQHLWAKTKKAGREEAGRLHHVAGERHQPEAAHRQQNPAAKIRFIGPRLPLNSLSELPATSAPIKPPTSNMVTAIRRDQIDAERSDIYRLPSR